VARRAGKAASRKVRQRNVPRAPARPHAPRPDPAVGTADARESTDVAPPPRVMPPAAAGIGSSLSLRERAEYHYVERDLRNIGILTALMAVLLFVAWLAFSALGLVG
jgi:hypothetical protein